MGKVQKRGVRVTPRAFEKDVEDGDAVVAVRLGDVAELVREGLLALSVQAGLAVVQELLEGDLVSLGAADSLREGLEETVTITRLGLISSDPLWRTIRSTNPIEQAYSACRTHHRNVKRWQDGRHAMRWCAAGLEQAAQTWRRVRGYKQIPILDAALRRHIQQLQAPQQAPMTIAA